jgi:hypothetical protein
VPSNGVYLPATNSVAIATNSTHRVRIDSSGNVGIGTTGPRFNLSLGTDVSTSTATPNTIDLGGTFSNTAGQNLKLRLYWDTNSTVAGLGVSGTSVDYVTFANSAHTFYADTTERARIDSSGRLLVGTSSTIPAYYESDSNWNGIFQVARGSLEATAHFSSWNSTAATTYGGAQIHLSACKSGTVGTHTSGALASGDTISTLIFNASDGTNFRNAASIKAQVDGGVSTGDVPGRLVFSTTADGASSPTERMRIGADGYNRVFAASSVYLAMTAQGAGTTTSVIDGNHSATSIASGNGTNSFRVWSNGNVINTNNSYGQISDAKLKENIEDAGLQWNDLKAVRVRNFNFKDGQTHRQIGVIAQEIEQVSPGLVFETPDRDEDGNETGEVTKGVNYSVLYMKAVKALQEAMERIEQLETEMAEVKAQLQAS